DNHSGPSERHALGQANHHQRQAWHRHVGRAEKIRADYAIMPDFVSYGPCEEYMPKPLRYRKNVHIILHLSNQVNDDIKATVHGDTELVIEVNGK
ncbi:hypothetical protein, partial [Bifidobacterium adolescentis]|uniref:hypothetical protein n=1 Tax=Bifidobacterium adolescentis TaxID=1680 RepID=UPI0034A32DFF